MSKRGRQNGAFYRFSEGERMAKRPNGTAIPVTLTRSCHLFIRIGGVWQAVGKQSGVD